MDRPKNPEDRGSVRQADGAGTVSGAPRAKVANAYGSVPATMFPRCVGRETGPQVRRTERLKCIGFAEDDARCQVDMDDEIAFEHRDAAIRLRVSNVPLAKTVDDDIDRRQCGAGTKLGGMGGRERTGGHDGDLTRIARLRQDNSGERTHRAHR